MNRFLLAGDKFVPETHLKQPKFTYSACRIFNENRERNQNFKERRNSKYIYQHELTCFQHDMAQRNFKDLLRRISSDKVLHDKAFNTAKNPKNDGYEGGLASMIYNFFDKKSSGGAVKSEIMSKQELAEELHKPVIKKYENGKVSSSFTDNV